MVVALISISERIFRDGGLEARSEEDWKIGIEGFEECGISVCGEKEERKRTCTWSGLRIYPANDILNWALRPIVSRDDDL